MSNKNPQNGAEEVANLRNQNESLWKIIEKQRVIIQNLQKDVAKLTAERDNLLDRNKQFEKERNRRSRVHSMLITEDTTINLPSGVGGLLDPSAAQKLFVSNVPPQQLQESSMSASSIPKELDNLTSSDPSNHNRTIPASDQGVDYIPVQLGLFPTVNDTGPDQNSNVPLSSPGPVPPPRSPYRQGTVKEHSANQKQAPPSPPIKNVEYNVAEGDLESVQGPSTNSTSVMTTTSEVQKGSRHIPPPILLPEDPSGTNEIQTSADPTQAACSDTSLPLRTNGSLHEKADLNISQNNISTNQQPWPSTAASSPPGSPPLGASGPLSPRAAIIDKDAQTFAMWKESASKKVKDVQVLPPPILTQMPRAASTASTQQILSPRTAANMNVVAAPPPMATYTGPFEVSSLLDVSSTPRTARSRDSYLPPVRQAPEHDPTVRVASPPPKSSFVTLPQPSINPNTATNGLLVSAGKVTKRESFMMPLKMDIPDLSLANPNVPVRHNSNPDISAQTQHLRQQQYTQVSPPVSRGTDTATSPNDDGFAPDEMSGITVKLVGSNITTNERGKEVISFIISVGKLMDTGDEMEEGIEELWRVEKLYSDFLGLDAKLKSRENRNIINKIGKLPEKALFMTHAPSKVDQRKLALERYLQHVISLPLKDVTDLCDFLSTNVLERGTEPTMRPGHREGYLTKRGKSFGGWKARYFVLDGPVLNYYETKDGHHLGSIRLTNAQIGRQQAHPATEGNADAANSYRHAFLILEPKKPPSSGMTRHVLCAESDADRDEWVEALVQYVGVPIAEGDLVMERKDTKEREKEDRLNRLRKGEKPRKVSKGEIKPIAAAPMGRMMLERGASADKLIANTSSGNMPPHRSMSDPAVGTIVHTYEVMPQGPISSDNVLPVAPVDDTSLMSSSMPNNASVTVRSSLENRASVDQHPQGSQRLGVTAAPIAVGKRSSSIMGYSADRVAYQPTTEANAPPAIVRQSSDRGPRSTSPASASVGVQRPHSQKEGKEGNKSLTLSLEEALLMADDADKEAEKKAKASGKRITFFSRKMFSGGSNPVVMDAQLQSQSTVPGGSGAQGPFRTFFPGRGSNEPVERPKGQRPANDDLTAKPPKQVFGVPLEQAIGVVRIKEGYELPAIVYRCIEYLDSKDAALEEGIYRLSGSTAVIRGLKERFNREGDVNLLGSGEYYDVHAIAGLLKMWLRELPTSVLTRDLLMEFLHVIDLLDRRDRVNELGRLVSELPLANYTLLRALTAHLMRVVQNSDVNKMTMRNVGIVFSPTLGIPAGVFNLFMTEFEYIFWTNGDGFAAPREFEGEQMQGDDDSQDTDGLSLGTIKEEKDRETTESSHTVNDMSKHLSFNMEQRSLSRTPTLRLREESGGRNNRNSMHYIDNAPDAIAGMERSLDAPFGEFEEEDEEEEEVSDLDSVASEEDGEQDSDEPNIYGGQEDDDDDDANDQPNDFSDDEYEDEYDEMDDMDDENNETFIGNGSEVIA
ncbi:hypothetical protein BC937DRAFT_92518 [Endogone sp. FLAS-F59071]|nr:hypothetical protein BC937DRAFT_92518 [Endogone sp. FLAS-F59071]|eukprot:RUS15397.1 hypothetical protein BC937DRAFT_92518 [Endogone sp. FLAS-F59071]